MGRPVFYIRLRSKRVRALKISCHIETLISNHRIRKKEDPWNAIIAGFFTGGSLAVRGGLRAMRNGAIGCAILLAVIEGVGIGFQRMMAEQTRLEPPPMPQSVEAGKAMA